ncbi:MAG TPA: mannosyltransferase family protein [Streptosporangiaceae bacterium]|nr:mannosyltransferase family protein [Streptosporangiaceae bacterium]
MSRPGPAYSDPVAPPSPAAADHDTGRPRFPLALAGVAVFAVIRLLTLGVSAFLLPRGKFHTLHYSLWHLIASWDSGRFLHIAAHGYSYVPGNLRLDVIFAWFPGYPAAIDTLSWIPGVGADRAAFTVTIAAGLAAAWGLTRLSLKLTGDPRISLLMVALWAVAPGSLAWAMLYSDALFCALAVWSLVALVDRRWLTAAGLTILAGTVRSTAMALVAAIAVAALPPVIRAVRAREPMKGVGEVGGAWWRPAAAVVTAPLGLVGYWAYSAWATHHLAGFVWVEENAHNSFDWGKGIVLAAKQAIIYGPNASVALTLLVIAAAVILTAWSLAERIPVYLHAYTLVVVVLALAPGPYYLGSKPRFLLPAMLLGLPLARLLARASIWVLIPVIAVLAAASTWFGIYLMTTGWAP